MPYSDRQVAALILWLFAMTGVVLLVVLALEPFDPGTLVVLGFLLIAAYLFSSLTVQVTRSTIQVRFGPGVIHKTFSVSALRRVAVVRNRWFYGFGIRRLRHGWLYNVSGLDAVEIEMADGQVNRIGTARPHELAQAIEAARAAAKSDR